MSELLPDDLQRLHDYSVTLEKLMPELSALIKRAYPILFSAWVKPSTTAAEIINLAEAWVKAIVEREDCVTDSPEWQRNNTKASTAESAFRRAAQGWRGEVDEATIHAAVEKWRNKPRRTGPVDISTTEQIDLERHIRAALSALRTQEKR